MVDKYKNLYEYFERSVKNYPKKSFVNNITYEDMDKMISCVDIVCQSSGLETGDSVGLKLFSSVEMVAILLSLIKNGFRVILVNPDVNQNKQIKYFEDMADIKMWISETELTCTSRKTIEYKYILKTIYAQHNSRINECAPIENKNPIVQCSSGTTGVPKMAERPLKAIISDIENIVNTYGYSSSDTIYCPVPICHGYGLTMGLFATMYVGAHLILEKWFIVKHLEEICRNQYPDIFLGVPDQFDILVRMRTNLQLSKIRWIFSSGTNLKEKTAKKFNDKFRCWINQMYGMMEASTVSANIHINEKNYMSVGTPTNGVHIELREQNSDGSGKIYVSSRSLSIKYLSGEKIENNGWYNTGDLGRIVNGDLYILKRWKE